MTGASKPEQQQIFVSSAMLAWVFPGLGYLHRGQKARGILVMVAVMSLILVGAVVGGIQVCDAARNPVAGLAQLGSLPGLVLNVIAANARPRGESGEAQDAMVDTTGGHPEEVGLIFTAVAGLLNVMAIVGSLTPLPRETTEAEGGGQDGGKPQAQGGGA